jgi:RHS repeat-associated protein
VVYNRHGSATYTYQLILSDEFTTEQMLASLTNAIASDWFPKPHESDHATAWIAEDESSASGRAVQARFKVWAPEGDNWSIEYFSWRKASDTNAAVCVATNELRGIGTGGWEYIEVPVAAAYTTYASNGCVYYRGEESWITVGCGNGANTGCSAGTCRLNPGAVYALGGAVNVTMGLGESLGGKGAGSLLLRGSKPDPKLTTPEGLEPFGNMDGDGNLSDIVRNSSGVLRQVLTPLCLADVVATSATSYTVSFYPTVNQYWWKGQDGFYDTSSATAFATCTVEQVDSTNHIRVTAVNEGGSKQYDYLWSAAGQGWTLVSGDGLRVDTSSWNAVDLVRTNAIRNALGELVYQETLHYQELPPLGRVVNRRVIGGPGAEQTNLWFYYDNAGSDGVKYGKVKLEVEPSGFWRRYEYGTTNGLVTKEVSQFLNAATNAADNLCRVVEFQRDLMLTGALSTETRIEKLLGQEVGRSYTLVFPGETWSIQCQTPGAAWDAANNLVTVTKMSATAGFEDRPASVLHPDGTLELYAYSDFGASGSWQSVMTGEPDLAKTNIVNGTRTETWFTDMGETWSRTVYAIVPGESQDIMVDADAYSHDSFTGSYTVSHSDTRTETVQYGCCGLAWTQDRDGTQTFYVSDVLGRQVASTRLEITTSNVLDAAGNTLATVRFGTDGSTVTLHGAAYDTAGRKVRETNALNGVTTYTYSLNGSGETVRTTTYPDTATRIETYYQDGSLKSVTGTAVFPVRYEYGVESDDGVPRPFTKEIKLNLNGTDTAEWTKTYTDLLGRNYKTVFAAASTPYPFTLSTFNNAGQLVSQADPDGVVTLYAYNTKGELEYTCLDSNRNGTLDFTGPDRITRTVNVVSNYFEPLDYATVRGTLTYQWTENGPVRVGERWVTINGLQSLTIASGLTNRTKTIYQGDGQRQVSITAPDGTSTVSQYQNGRLLSTTRYGQWGWPMLEQVTYSYDEHGRQNEIGVLQPDSVTYALTTLGYNNADLVTTNTTPSPDGLQPGQTTVTFHDASLRAWRIVQPDNTSVTNEFFATGLLKKTSGSRTYPVEYTYDYAGRTKTMMTWQNFASGAGAATTTWNYDAYRGWLAHKRYHDNTGPNYTYTPAGRLATRTWARGLTTTYGYNNLGDLLSVDYSDGTPDVTYGYDRRGRQTTVTQSGGTTLTRLLDDGGRLLRESYTGGPLDGLSVTNAYDEFLRRTNVALHHSTAPILQHSYAYEAYSGRLESVSQGDAMATYSYVENSPLLAQITFSTNGQTVMTTTQGYDVLNRLTNLTSSVQVWDDGWGWQNVPVTAYAYGYNLANQRTNLTPLDESRWVYQYDNLGQVISGRKYWSDGTPVAGQQFDYAFDDIGNRKAATRDGRMSNYTPNLLNQYASRTVPGHVNILGEATNAATVSVGTQDGWFPTSRHGDYFRAEVTASNGAAPVWLGITNLAVLNQGTNEDLIATNTGHLLLAKTPEAFTYDLDGNLTSDSLWTNVWNGENRRVLIESRSTVPTAGKAREQWTILPDGRWVERIVSTNNGSGYVAMQTNRFVWDGNVLLAVLNHTNGLKLAFMRGMDLSGSLQGAGGVGGLLAVQVGAVGPVSLTNTVHFACSDGNGNVMALVNAVTCEESARYEYGPFGEFLRATGPMALVNPLGFSTQYRDDVTGDWKYLHRDLDADTGRWPNRDPINDLGFNLLRGKSGASDLDEEKNLYGFVQNNPITSIDPFGLFGMIPPGVQLGDPNAKPCMDEATDAQRKHFGERSGNVYWGGYRHCVAACCLIKRYSCVGRIGVWYYGKYMDSPDDPDYEHERAGERAGKAAARMRMSCEAACLTMYPVDKWDPTQTREETPLPTIP